MVTRWLWIKIQKFSQVCILYMEMEYICISISCLSTSVTALPSLSLRLILKHSSSNSILTSNTNTVIASLLHKSWILSLLFSITNMIFLPPKLVSKIDFFKPVSFRRPLYQLSEGKSGCHIANNSLSSWGWLRSEFSELTSHWLCLHQLHSWITGCSWGVVGYCKVTTIQHW